MTGGTFKNCDIPIPSSIQRFSVKILMVSLSLVLMACAPTTDLDQQPLTQPSARPLTPQIKPQPLSEMAQYLPIAAIATMSGREIQLEVASTAKEQEKGLMFRPPLPDDRGMLFPFTPERPVAFWMKNTPSPLDIIFLLDGEVKAIARNATTCKTNPCTVYPESPVVADNVIEVRSGLTQEIGLQVGDRISVKFLLPKKP
jgi:uncharacterized membrane protein (UPF0127 family)